MCVSQWLLSSYVLFYTDFPTSISFLKLEAKLGLYPESEKQQHAMKENDHTRCVWKFTMTLETSETIVVWIPIADSAQGMLIYLWPEQTH